MEVSIVKKEEEYFLQTKCLGRILREEKIPNEKIVTLNGECLHVVSTLIIYPNREIKQLCHNSDKYEIRNNEVYLNKKFFGYLLGIHKPSKKNPNVIAFATTEEHDENIRFLNEEEIKKLIA